MIFENGCHWGHFDYQNDRKPFSVIHRSCNVTWSTYRWRPLWTRWNLYSYRDSCFVFKFFSQIFSVSCLEWLWISKGNWEKLQSFVPYILHFLENNSLLIKQSDQITMVTKTVTAWSADKNILNTMESKLQLTFWVALLWILTTQAAIHLPQWKQDPPTFKSSLDPVMPPFHLFLISDILQYP